MAEARPSTKRTKPCPLCKKMSIEAYFPFCSKRCADVDLGRWLGGAYAIPTNEKPASTDGEEGSSES